MPGVRNPDEKSELFERICKSNQRNQTLSKFIKMQMFNRFNDLSGGASKRILTGKEDAENGSIERVLNEKDVKENSKI